MSNTTGAADGLDIVRLSDEQRAVEILGRLVLARREVVNNLSRLRPTQRAEFRVTIFGFARTAAPADIDIPRCVDSAEEAIALLQSCHREWLASRSPAR